MKMQSSRTNSQTVVSIIIPTFGSNTNPCRAIESVFEQDYPFIEVVVVDDNGKGTPQQIKNEKAFQKYKDKDDFVYLIHESNMNGSVARNTGANAAKGSFLCFLDDDDYFSDSQKISKQVSVLEILDSTFAGSFSSLRIIDSRKKVRFVKAKDNGNLLINFIKSKLSIGTGAPIISKSSFIELGGFNECFDHHQDWEFFARLLDKFKLKAVHDAYYDREYKIIPKRGLDLRKIRMDRYVCLMKNCIQSLKKRTLYRLMKEKYYPLYLACLRDKNKKLRKAIYSENRFNVFDCIKMFFYALVYFVKNILKI